MEIRRALWALGFYVGFGTTAGLVFYRPFSEPISTVVLPIVSLCLALFCIFKYFKS